VTGELKNTPDQKIYLEELYFSQKDPAVLDTAEIKNGKFSLTALAPGESAKVAGWEVKLNDVNPVVGDNWVAVEGEMIAAKNGNEFPLYPQSRQFFKPPMQTSEAALLTRWNGQLYVVIAQPDQEGDGRWQVRLWWKPFVTFIWGGAILIALGGAIALLGRMVRRTKNSAINKWQTE